MSERQRRPTERFPWATVTPTRVGSSTASELISQGAVAIDEAHRCREYRQPQHRRHAPAGTRGIPPPKPEFGEGRIDAHDDEAHPVDPRHGRDLDQWQHLGLRVAGEAPGVADKNGRTREQTASGEFGPHPGGAGQQRQRDLVAAGERPVDRGEHHKVGTRHEGEDADEERHRDHHRLLEVVRHRTRKPVPGDARPHHAPQPTDEERLDEASPTQGHEQGNHRDPGERGPARGRKRKPVEGRGHGCEKRGDRQLPHPAPLT